MFSQYFGHYLLNKRLITGEQLREALEYQQSVHVKLGVLAINAGFMSSEQVREIHYKQSKVDRRFGELAVQSGYLTAEQLDILLNTQKTGHVLLGQALLEKEYLTLEQLQKALEEYKNEYALSERQFNVLQQGDVDEYVRIFFNFGETLWSKTYADYVALMIRNVIRFIDDNPRVEVKMVPKEYSTKWLVFQEVGGRINMLTGISLGDESFLEMSKRFANEDFHEIDELAQATMGEFLNLHNGIFLVNMSNHGIELSMKPQTVLQDQTLKGLKKGYIASFFLPSCAFDIILL